MNLLKQIRQKLPGLALLSAAFLFCGSAGRACDPDDIDHMLDPENLDMSSRPLEGIVSIQEIITLRRGTDKEELVPAMYFDDLCLKKAVLLDSSDILSIKAIPQKRNAAERSASPESFCRICFGMFMRSYFLSLK